MAQEISSYNACNSSRNMANGQFMPSYESVLTLTDENNTPHNVTVGFLKLDMCTLAVEVYRNDVIVGKQIAYGIITIDQEGLSSIDAALTLPMTFLWGNETPPSTECIEYNWNAGFVQPLIKQHEDYVLQE